MQLEWRGHYLDGRSPEPRLATVQLQAHGLHITLDSGAAFHWPFEEITQTQGFYAGEQVRLERGGDWPEMLLVSDSQFLAELHRFAPERAKKFHDPGRRPARLRATLVAGVASIILLVFIYLYGVPALAAAISPWVPVSWEEKLGATVTEHLAPLDRQCKDPVRGQPINELVAKLAGAAPAHPYRFRVFIVNDPTFNALAAPGGYIVIFRGLLAATRTPEELAGVLAHELAHVLKRHSTKLMLQHVSIGLLMSAVFGDASGIAGFGLDAAQTLVLLRYSRGHESEADEEGLKMLVAAGIDANGMIDLFRRIRRTEGGSPAILKYLASHPDTEERIARLEALARTARPVKSQRLIYDWADVKKICG